MENHLDDPRALILGWSFAYSAGALFRSLAMFARELRGLKTLRLLMPRRWKLKVHSPRPSQ